MAPIRKNGKRSSIGKDKASPQPSTLTPSSKSDVPISLEAESSSRGLTQEDYLFQQMLEAAALDNNDESEIRPPSYSVSWIFGRLCKPNPILTMVQVPKVADVAQSSSNPFSFESPHKELLVVHEKAKEVVAKEISPALSIL